MKPGGHLQIITDLIRDLVHVLLDALTVPLRFPIGLGMVRRRQDVADPHQAQVIVESHG